jgi:hypothetical protein
LNPLPESTPVTIRAGFARVLLTTIVKLEARAIDDEERQALREVHQELIGAMAAAANAPRVELSVEHRNAIYDATGGGEAYCMACERAEESLLAKGGQS